MAAPTINAIREALATRLGNIADTQVSAYALSNPTPPALQIVGAEIEYDVTMGAGANGGLQLKIQGLVGLPTDIGAQKLLGSYSDHRGSKSVYAAVAADHTLGGVVLHANVISASEEQIYTTDRGAYIGREWIVEILAPGA